MPTLRLSSDSGIEAAHLDLSLDNIVVEFRSSERAVAAAAHARESKRYRKAVREGSRAAPNRHGNYLALYLEGILNQDANLSFVLDRSMLASVLGPPAEDLLRVLMVYVDRDRNLRAVPTGQIAIQFREGTPAAEQLRVLKQVAGAKGRWEFEEDDATLALVEPFLANPSEAFHISEQIWANEESVEFAEPSLLTEVFKASTNDPLLPKQWYLDNPKGSGNATRCDLNVFAAWSALGNGSGPSGGPGVVAAVLDDGIDIDHPDLLPNVWRGPSGLPAGRNCVKDGPEDDPRPRQFETVANDDPNNDIHGTMCAGLVAARGNNRIGMAGVAYEATLLPVRIMSGSWLDDTAAAAGIRWAALHADVLSCSWEVTPTNKLLYAIRHAAQSGRNGKGCLIFCASGNSGKSIVSFPASSQWTIGVGASNDHDERSNYSCYGPGLDVLAPSSDTVPRRAAVITTRAARPGVPRSNKGDYHADFGGTSAATPLAAGVGALMLCANPNLSRNDAISLLRMTAVKVDPGSAAYGATGRSSTHGFGRVDAFAAVSAARKLFLSGNPSPPTPPIMNPSPATPPIVNPNPATPPII